MRRICVQCGSSSGFDPCYQSMAQRLGQALLDRNYELVYGYYDLLLSFFDNAVSKGFMKKEHRDMLLVSNTPEDMLTQIEAYRSPKVEKWV